MNVKSGIQSWNQTINLSIPQYSMKSISKSPSTLTKPQQGKQRWLIGSGLVITLVAVAAVIAVRQKPDLLVPVIKAGVPLAGAAKYSKVVDYAVKRAETPQITVQELKQLIDSKATDYVLLDVRTPEEYNLSKIPGSVNVPLTEIEKGQGINQVKSMLNGRRLIAYCTHGYRSGKALVQLQDAGIKGTQYAGGIKEWTEKIDPSLPRNNW